MLISTTTKYRCDGCNTESQVPYGWLSLIPVSFGPTTLVIGWTPASRDYCSLCVEKMRKAVSAETLRNQTGWQSIQTAPTYISVILFDGRVRIGSVSSNGAALAPDQNVQLGDNTFYPTHWMPLPAPPAH